jgi:hypothetical protein
VLFWCRHLARGLGRRTSRDQIRLWEVVTRELSQHRFEGFHVVHIDANLLRPEGLQVLAEDKVPTNGADVPDSIWAPRTVIGLALQVCARQRLHTCPIADRQTNETSTVVCNGVDLSMIFLGDPGIHRGKEEVRSLSMDWLRSANQEYQSCTSATSQDLFIGDELRAGGKVVNSGGSVCLYIRNLVWRETIETDLLLVVLAPDSC